MGLTEHLTESAQNMAEIKSEVDALLSFANETTGAEDVRLGDAVMTLASGFGSGGSSGGTWTEVANLTVSEKTNSVTLFNVSSQINQLSVYIYLPNVDSTGALRIADTRGDAFIQHNSFGDTSREKHYLFNFDATTGMILWGMTNSKTHVVVNNISALFGICNIPVIETGKNLSASLSNGFPAGTKIIVHAR